MSEPADFDCDAWRAAYDTTTFEQQKESYDFIREGSPEQVCFNLTAAQRGLRDVGSVTEIGGWRGELAGAILAETASVWSWRNYEICRWAVTDGNRCIDPRYAPVELFDWPWNIELEPADAFVASHTVEHMRFEQFKLLSEQFGKFERVHLQIPIPLADPPNWQGYDGTHIFEASWEDLNAHVISCGFKLAECDLSLTSRTYSR